MKRSAGLFLFTLALLTWRPAAAIDSTQVHREITDAYEVVADSFYGLLHYGTVRVEPEAGGFRVSVPGVTFGTPANFVELGTVSYLLTPLDDDRYRVEDLRLPETLLIKQPAGVVGTVAVPAPSFIGVFSKRLRNFSDVDLTFRDLRMVDATGATQVGVGRIAAVVSSLPKPGGAIDQDSRYVVENLSLMLGKDTTLKLAGAELAGRLRDFRAGEYSVALRQLEAEAAEIEQEGEATGEDWTELLRAGRAVLAVYPDLAADFRLRGLEVTDPTGAKLFTLEQAGSSSGAEYTDGGAVDLSGGIDLAGLRIEALGQQSADLFGQLIPRGLAFGLRIENLPSTKLLDTALAQIAGPTPQATGAALVATVPQLLAIVTEANTVLRLTESFVDAGPARVEMHGAFRLDPAATLGAVGELAVKVTGFDALFASLKQALGSNPDAMKQIAVLQLLGLFAAREKAADGTVTDRYTLTLDPSGTVLLNGKNISALAARLQ